MYEYEDLENQTPNSRTFRRIYAAPNIRNSNFLFNATFLFSCSHYGSIYIVSSCAVDVAFLVASLKA